MIETLTNLKNNKVKRNVAQNQGGAAVERMKKFLASLSKSRHGTLSLFRKQAFTLFLIRVSSYSSGS
jgi:hypothetical protein